MGLAIESTSGVGNVARVLDLCFKRRARAFAAGKCVKKKQHETNVWVAFWGFVRNIPMNVFGFGLETGMQTL